MQATRYYAVYAHRHTFLARLNDGHAAGPYCVIDVRTEQILRAGLSSAEAAGVIGAWTGDPDSVLSVDWRGAERWAARGATLSRHPSVVASAL